MKWLASRKKNAKTRPVRTGFLKDENGSLVIFALFIFLLMIMIGGLAIDLMRYETQRARLQSTLDRGVLAAASLDQPLGPVDVVVDYFNKNGLVAYIDPNNILVEDTLTARRVTASASMQVDSTFLRLLGINHLTAPAAGAAEESASRTEISLIVDVSGSMGWSSYSGSSKIYELRQAATEFVNIVQCNPEDPTDTVNCTVEPDMVSITLIPYAEQVLAGEIVLDQLNVTNEHTSSSCLNFTTADYNSANIDPTQLYNRTGHFDPWRSYSSTPSNWTCKTNSWRQILPMENDPADLRSAISSLGASGYTSIDVGMKWGSAFLDPSFQPVVDGLIAAGNVDGAYNDRPYSYTENGIKKVVVIMTDGVNTTQHYLADDHRDGLSPVWYNSYYDEYSILNSHGSLNGNDHEWYWTNTGGHWDDHPRGDLEPGTAVQLTYPELWRHVTWDWYDNWWWLENSGSSYGNSTKNSRLDAICSAAKAQNITVYTIGFEVTTSSAAVMESCASSPAHFFDVEGSDLGGAFASIARQISALRLVN